MVSFLSLFFSNFVCFNTTPRILKTFCFPVFIPFARAVLFCVEVVTSETARAEATSTEKPQDEPPALVPSVVPVAASAPAPSKSVVDLTVSDSDDDDEPLAKRRAPANPKPDSTIKFSGMLEQYLV